MGSVGDGLGLEIVCVKQRRGGLTPRQWISWSDDGFVWGRSNLPFGCKQIKHSRTSRITVVDLGLTVNQKGRFASGYACDGNCRQTSCTLANEPPVHTGIVVTETYDER